MQKLTKIIATIGPATESEEVLTQMMQAGMNIARFNTKHSDPAWHAERVARVKAVAAKQKMAVGVLLDLQGPEIRINTAKGEAFELKKGETCQVLVDGSPDAPKAVYVPKQVVEALPEGSSILFEDGACELTIVEKHPDHLVARAELDCTIKHRKTMNTPGVVMEMPSLTDRDMTFLEGVDLKHVDYVGLSFVRDKADLDQLRSELDKRGSQAKIIAKIENQTALDNLEELIEYSDAIMVARGDLGVEVAFEELIHWQRTIIEKCRCAAKPVITATEMLKSMVSKPRPTRAEVSDVAHAIYDGTDAIMLSDETTIGEYPVKCVETQAKIATFNEPFATSNTIERDRSTLTDTICASAITMLSESPTKVSYIVCLTETGRTAQLLASYHPNVPVIAITPHEVVTQQLALVYGVKPVTVSIPEGQNLSTEFLANLLRDEQIVQKGETAIIIHGPNWRTPNQTNTQVVYSF